MFLYRTESEVRFGGRSSDSGKSSTHGLGTDLDRLSGRGSDALDELSVSDDSSKDDSDDCSSESGADTMVGSETESETG